MSEGIGLPIAIGKASGVGRQASGVKEIIFRIILFEGIGFIFSWLLVSDLKYCLSPVALLLTTETRRARSYTEV